MAHPCLFMGALAWFPVDEEIARLAGSLATEYRRSHNGIHAIDSMIVATATVVGAELLTTNVRHFPMISGLRPRYGSWSTAGPHQVSQSNPRIARLLAQTHLGQSSFTPAQAIPDEPDQDQCLSDNCPTPTLRCHTHDGYGEDEEREDSKDHEPSWHGTRPT